MKQKHEKIFKNTRMKIKNIKQNPKLNRQNKVQAPYKSNT